MVRRIHHAALRVADLDEAQARWAVQFGFTPAQRREGRAYLACAYEPYSLELLPANGDGPGPDHTGWELARDVSLGDAKARLDGLGIAHTERDGALHLTDPDGHGVELLPYAAPADRRPDIARTTTTLHGFHPRKLGHINSMVADLAATREFYVDALGLRVADRLGDVGAWLHCNADHHAAAFVASDTPHFHHIALELADWGDMRVALDHLAQHGRWLTWGPLRHALGRNLAAYVRIPEERLQVELYCDMEQLADDHEPREWPDDVHSSNTWGILPPRSYFRFDDAAIEHERQGLEAQGHPLPQPGDHP